MLYNCGCTQYMVIHNVEMFQTAMVQVLQGGVNKKNLEKTPQSTILQYMNCLFKIVLRQFKYFM